MRHRIAGAFEPKGDAARAHKARQECTMEALQVRLNQSSLELNFSNENSVAEVLTQIKEQHLEPGHVLSTVRIDGVPRLRNTS